MRVLNCDLTALAAVAPPAERLQVILCRKPAFCDGDDVVDLKQQVRFLVKGCTAILAGIMVALFDRLAQLAGHQSTLPGSALLELDFLREKNDKAV